MAGLYYYVPVEKLKDIIYCGLKLSEWYDREITLPGLSGSRKVLRALLNPRDDSERLRDSSYQCLRLEVDLDYCRVGDSDLYKMGLENISIMKHYIDNLTMLCDYRFGTFRNPEVLVNVSVLSEKIEVTGQAMDIPILYESSEVLYLNNLLEKHEEVHNDSGNHLLYAYYVLLESKGKVSRYDNKENQTAVFFDSESKKYTVLKIPEGGY